MNSDTRIKDTRGTLMMLGASICFSLGGILLKIIPWNPFAINGVRNLIAACVIGLYIFFTRHRMKFNFTVFMGAVCMAGVTTMFAIANKLTTAGNAIVLQYSMPIWLILLMFLFFRKKPSRLEVITIALVLIGILCFFFDSLSTGRIAGDLIALFSGLFYAGMFMLNQFEKGDALSSMVIGLPPWSCGKRFSLLLFLPRSLSLEVCRSDWPTSCFPSVRGIQIRSQLPSSTPWNRF